MLPKELRDETVSFENHKTKYSLQYPCINVSVHVCMIKPILHKLTLVTLINWKQKSVRRISHPLYRTFTPNAKTHNFSIYENKNRGKWKNANDVPRVTNLSCTNALGILGDINKPFCVHWPPAKWRQPIRLRWRIGCQQTSFDGILCDIYVQIWWKSCKKCVIQGRKTIVYGAATNVSRFNLSEQIVSWSNPINIQLWIIIKFCWSGDWSEHKSCTALLIYSEGVFTDRFRVSRRKAIWASRWAHVTYFVTDDLWPVCCQLERF